MKDEFNVEFGVDPFKSDMLRDEFVLIGDVLLLPLRSLSVNSAGELAQSPPRLLCLSMLLVAFRLGLTGIVCL